MSKALITEEYLTDIADAIRAKNYSSDSYTPPQMAAAIAALPDSGITPTGTVSITQNGTHNVAQYASANVNVHVSSDPHVTNFIALAMGNSHSEYLSAVEGQKLLVLQMVNSSNQLNIQEAGARISAAGSETQYLSPIWSQYHFSAASGDNVRQYRIDVYDIPLETEGTWYVEAWSRETYAHTSIGVAFISDAFYISKIMTSAAAATSGSNSENGCALYGTFTDASGGSVGYADYTANTQITTNNPGSGNKSSFIIWLKPID